MKFKSFRNTSGFTLVELLVVIAIIGILSSIALLNLSEIRKKGLARATEMQMEEIAKAARIYEIDYGTYPLGIGPTNGGDTTLTYPADFYNSYIKMPMPMCTDWTYAITQHAATGAYIVVLRREYPANGFSVIKAQHCIDGDCSVAIPANQDINQMSTLQCN